MGEKQNDFLPGFLSNTFLSFSLEWALRTAQIRLNSKVALENTFSLMLDSNPNPLFSHLRHGGSQKEQSQPIELQLHQESKWDEIRNEVMESIRFSFQVRPTAKSSLVQIFIGPWATLKGTDVSI